MNTLPAASVTGSGLLRTRQAAWFQCRDPGGIDITAILVFLIARTGSIIR